MKASKKLKLFFFILCILVSSNLWANTSQETKQLIQEVNKLYHQLPTNDSNLTILNLRLADLYFEYAQNLENESALGGVDLQDKADVAHHKAIELYQLALSGHKGKFPAPQGSKLVKIHFQLGRLFQRQLKMSEAVNEYQLVLKSQSADSNLKREAALNLAEYFEEVKGPEASEKYYDEAISLCDSVESCSYIHYRRSWVYFREHKLPQAISEIEKGLLDGQGKIKEQAVRDYIVFLAETPGDGSEVFSKLESFSSHWKKPELLVDLMEAFFAAGNREAGAYALNIINNRTPSTFYQIRLLEELYGFQRYAEMEEILLSLKEKPALPGEEKEIKSIHTILQRLILQLDSERKSRPSLSAYLIKSIDLYLNLFPQDELREKMIEGYLAALTDEKEHEKSLVRFINEEKTAQRKNLEIKWRLKHLALAQEKKNQAVVVEEAQALANLETRPEKKRQYTYLQARALYEQKRYDESYVLFIQLSNIPTPLGSFPDQWAINSQNLALDILNLEKKFQLVSQQAK